MQAVLITLHEAPPVEPSGDVAGSEPPVPPVPAEPAVDPRHEPQEATRIRPTPAPEPEARPEPARQPAPRGEPKTEAESPAQAPEAKPAETESAPVEEQRWALLLSQVRSNWLQPPGAPSTFRCRLWIEYRDEVVTGVELGEGCDDAALGDSIVRAVWKTRTLPLEPGTPLEGRLNLEFTP